MAHCSNQFQLPWLRRAHPHALDLAVGRLQHFEAQAVFLYHFPPTWNSAGEFADQSRNGCRIFSFRLRPEQFVETVDIHTSGNDETAVAVTYDFRFIALVPDLADNFFHQVFDRDESRDSAVLIDNDRHADILLLHLAQQVASQLAFRYEVNIPAHDAAHRPHVRFAVGNLQHVLGVNNSFNVMD